jgi:hypothetical protein
MHRFWDMQAMISALSVHYRMSSAIYPRSWIFRTLVSVYREQYQVTRYARCAYGKDWKGGIKDDLLEYTGQGRLPMVGLEIGSRYVGKAEMERWVVSGKTEVAGLTLTPSQLFEKLRAIHGDGAEPVLFFKALQLSMPKGKTADKKESDRDLERFWASGCAPQYVYEQALGLHAMYDSQFVVVPRR